MDKFSKRELSVMLGALAAAERAHTGYAAEFDEKNIKSIPEDMRDIPERMLETARIADKLRNDVSTEMHKRAMTSCDLAHPAHKSCPWGVDA